MLCKLNEKRAHDSETLTGSSRGMPGIELRIAMQSKQSLMYPRVSSDTSSASNGLNLFLICSRRNKDNKIQRYNKIQSPGKEIMQHKNSPCFFIFSQSSETYAKKNSVYSEHKKTVGKFKFVKHQKKVFYKQKNTICMRWNILHLSEIYFFLLRGGGGIKCENI